MIDLTIELSYSPLSRTDLSIFKSLDVFAVVSGA